MLEGVGEKPFFFLCVSLRVPVLLHLINLKNLFKAVLLYEGVISLSPVRLSQAGAGGDTAPPYCRQVPAAVSPPAPSCPWLSAGPAVGVHA